VYSNVKKLFDVYDNVDIFDVLIRQKEIFY